LKHKIYFPQFGKEAEIFKGKTILDYTKELDIPISSSCGGAGICKECKVVIEKGIKGLNKKTDLEKELDGNERLACQAVTENISNDISIKKNKIRSPNQKSR